MPNKLLLLAIVLTLSTLFLGCVASPTTNTGDATQSIASSTSPTTGPLDDFYIIYETVWIRPDGDFMTLLDTQSCIVGKPLSIGKYASADYHMPQEDLQALYNAIVEYDIASYNGEHIISGNYGTVTVIVTPQVYYRITFRLNGEFYMIFFEHSIIYRSSGGYDNLRDFIAILESYRQDNDAFRDLPPSI